ncbi:hypothetical protein C7B61_00345 [filamentous cyanobacterium CCP1]|nr:hypothetical protein C7B76_16715 [filamentous cyanobacterium CCP2]PSB68546.1 hypothetical protein C7B61_00345 [filamentous cyanobacterium CCP1]
MEIEIARTRLTDKQAELSHKQNILAVKGNIRSLTEEQWGSKQQVAEVGVQISSLGVDKANDKLGIEQELLSVSKTLGEERIAKARRKLYEIHEFEGVEG